MNVKELIAKVRFSHILCLSIGVLIPIYADMLFLHEFTSSTVSAIMDTVVAGSVIYAAWSVRNWTKEKINNKGFEHSEKILGNIHQTHLMIYSLYQTWVVFCNNYTNGYSLDDYEIESMRKDKIIALDEAKKLNIKTGELLSEIHGLKTWNIKIHNAKEYLEYIEHVDIVRKDIEEYILQAANTKNDLNRYSFWEENKEKISTTYTKAPIMYLKLNITFEDVFFYEKTTEKTDVDMLYEEVKSNRQDKK